EGLRSAGALARGRVPVLAAVLLERRDPRREELTMASVLYMSMSLDGFIAGPNERPDSGLGDGGERLHEWFLTGGGDVDLDAVRELGGVNGHVMEEAMSTGAIVAGRGPCE